MESIIIKRSIIIENGISPSNIGSISAQSNAIRWYTCKAYEWLTKQANQSIMKHAIVAMQKGVVTAELFTQFFPDDPCNCTNSIAFIKPEVNQQMNENLRNNQ
jgi:hypothetical protein